jgi:uncharacterized protein YbjT (DUF2867 family)
VRVLLIGATGFIGSAVLVRLRAEGHQVVGLTRRKGSIARRLPADGWIVLDMAAAVTPEAWRPHLAGIDAVVNCAGALQDGASDSTQGVHVAGAAALFAACEAAGVRRVIHFSAMGVDRGELSTFSRSKAAGEEALTRRDLDWVILRPSVVVGRSAYGGSALFRGLAALPLLQAVSGAGRLQIVQLDEVAETVSVLLSPDAPRRVALEVAGPERLTFEDVVATYRRWLGFPAARAAPGGALLMPLAYGLGDLAGLLGWRPPIRTNARREMTRGAVGDNAEWRRLTGIEPRTLYGALMSEPASVQERWFANLYLLKALVLTVIAGFWLATAFISLGPGYGLGLEIMHKTALADFAAPTVVAGALADLAVGLSIAWRRTTRVGLLAAMALSLGYLVIGTVLQPQLWAEPLGPMTKIFPILALHLVALAILEDR